MKRIAAVVCMIMLMVCFSAPLCMAQPNEAPSSNAGGLQIEKSSPKDGDKGTSADNLSVKLYFNDDIYSEDTEAANRKCFSMVSEKGEKVPIKVVLGHRDKTLVLVVADTTSKYKVKQDTNYVLKIDGNLVSANGKTLGDDQQISFKTVNQKMTQLVNFGMMALMMVIIIFMTMKSSQKKEEKEAPTDKKVNPYKEAKKTGKSVEEIVAKTQKEKAKREAKEAKSSKGESNNSKADEVVEEQPLKPGHMKVKGPKPISEAGSSYKTGRKALAEEKARKEAERKARGTTNPKKGKKKKKSHK